MGKLEKEIILENKLNEFEDDIFDGKDIDIKSFYRLNTKNKINRIFKCYSKKMFIFTPDPAYYFNSKLFFILYRFIHFIFPKFFSGILICFSKK